MDMGKRVLLLPIGLSFTAENTFCQNLVYGRRTLNAYLMVIGRKQLAEVSVARLQIIRKKKRLNNHFVILYVFFDTKTQNPYKVVPGILLYYS